MKRLRMSHHRIPGLLAAAALAWLPAAHALDPAVESGMEVTGLVDLDGLFGPQPPLSNQVQTAATLPLTVSNISIADSAAGSFAYTASSDIGLLELKVFGSLSNTGANPLGDGETPVLRVSAEVRDVLTLNSTLTSPYQVSFELVVDGAISGSGSAIANASIDFGLLSANNGTDFGSYGFGSIADTLSVTRTVSGASVEMDLGARLNFSVFGVDAGSTVTGALDNTATLRLVLPPGVTLASSASGTFGVPIVPPPIPEPGTWGLMLAGVGLLGWRCRSARATRTATAASTPPTARA
jgi:PEP-CTERM motif